ncbi:ADP-ribose pyrophosphatase [invertebrate metagenome]|uniref:ADP-ribose pyrophosphatase n=1 Tax=invertebrate metagenome TaxID=1711999 RepID=A0A484H6W3_9ZZZZ
MGRAGRKMLQAAQAADVEVLAYDTAYKGFFRIDHYCMRHRLYDGSWGPVLERELFERGHAVAVLLYDPHRDTLVLIEQFRLGAMAVGWNPWLLEVVAGIIESGETAEQVAHREVREESGCEMTALERVGHYLVSPGGSTETVELFCGRVDSVHAGGVHGRVEEGENIRVVVIPADAALGMLTQGAFNNGAILIVMLWFALHRDRLRREWRHG